MSRLFRIFFVLLLVLAISAPSWAFGGSNGKRYHHKSKRHSHYLSYFDFHKIKVWIQYKRLIRAYKRAGEDARQKFLDEIGFNQPGTDADIEKIRQEYEQQIAQLNSTIASYEQQLADLKASCDQQLADMEASCDQQLADLRTSHQAEIDEMTAACSRNVEEAYDRGMEDGKATCPATPPTTGVHPMINSWSTGGGNPNIVDVDNSGNVYILDNNNQTVVRYDSSGNQNSQWGSSAFELPVDMSLDAQGNVFILDQQSEYHLQKYSSDGTSSNMPPTIGVLESPTGFYVRSNGYIYVTDGGGAYGGRILVFNAYGNMMISFGEVPELAGETYHDVAVNPQDQNVYLLTSSKVAVFSQYGSYLRDWQGDFSAPSGIAISDQGEIYIVDRGSHQVYEYDANGNLVDTFGAADLVDPGRPAVDGNGLIYVGDNNDQQVKVFQ